MQNKKIVFLASDCESSRWVFNAINHQLKIESVIIEQPISKKILFKARIKKIGLTKVIGQTMFSLLVVPFLRLKAKQRKAEIITQYQLNNTIFKHALLHNIASINDEVCLQIIQQIQPDVIIVNGTRIISKKILTCTKAIFINMHVGITPQYRGSHGGYWALYNNDIKNFGTTIHIVDAGIDTGAVLKHAYIIPQVNDNFTTYPVLQVAIGISALKEVLPQVLKGDYSIKNNTEKGTMYYQPTLWQYFLGR